MKTRVIAYVLLDIVCTAAGMGVPIFNILLGFLVGAYAGYVLSDGRTTDELLRKLLVVAGLTSLFTFVMMAVIWLPSLGILYQPESDIANFGTPMILFTPLPSFIGWIVLMVVVSPFLQILATVFAGNVAVVALGRRTVDSQE
jgi:hypothetical protein